MVTRAIYHGRAAKVLSEFQVDAMRGKKGVKSGAYIEYVSRFLALLDEAVRRLGRRTEPERVPGGCNARKVRREIGERTFKYVSRFLALLDEAVRRLGRRTEPERVPGGCNARKERREIGERTFRYVSRFLALLDEAVRRLGRAQPHLESPQERQVIHPSIIISATVLHFVQSCAPSG